MLSEYGLSDCIKCFVDNNPLKSGTVLNGIDVVTCEDAFKDYHGEVVLITCGEGDEIMLQLKEYDIPMENIYVPDISVIDETDPVFINNHITLFEYLYDLLGDDKSRDVLAGIINYKMTHDMTFIQNVADASEEQYFDDELIRYSKDDVFLDCGGYTGDTVESYARHSKGVYKKAICLEADRDNCSIIDGKKDVLKIELVNAACWSEKAQLTFDKIGSGSGTVLTEGQAKSEVILVNADTIDNIVGKEKIRFIKMDIEGAEYDALIGARKTIERDRPTLMISAYHKQDDLLRLPALIMSMNYDYTLYLRHYRSMSVQETVLYAIP